jgi:type IV pilus assembly protein PilQ
MPTPIPLRRLSITGALLSAVLCCGALPALGQQADPVNDPIPGAEPEITVTDRGTVQMHVSDLPLSTVLQVLSIEGKRNIIASPSVTGTVTASLYDVTFEEALAATLHANNAGYRTAGKFIYVYSNDELAVMEQAANPPFTRVFRLSYINAADAQEYLAPLLAEGETITVSPPPATGIGSSADEAGSNESAAQAFVVVTARRESQERIEQVLREIDVRPRQVLIEATILRATLDDNNELGVDFTFVEGVNFQMLNASSSGLTNLDLGDLPGGRLDKCNAIAQTEFNQNISPGGLTIGIIKDDIAVFIRALESVTDTTVLANPKVLALNRQRGHVIVGRRDGYLTTTVTETQAVQTVEFLETGTQLIFRPFIGEDGFVRVELHPEDSSGFVNAQGLPTKQTTEVTTNVIVEDGHTILIGGLFREVSKDSRSQIPLLGSIPGVGQVFRSNVDSTSREEVIILMTVHIVKDHDRYAAASAAQWENVERMRVGLRQGLMWHGRERLAQFHYRKALDAFSKGDTDKALWHSNMAIHNNARLLPAIELKEKIMKERMWEPDGTGIRAFIPRLLAEERGVPFAPFARPIPESPEAEPAEQPAGEGNE